MADTNEEQLLSDLLGDIAREDACLDAAHLEARVMEAVDPSASARPMQSSFGATGLRYWVIAAAVVTAVLVPAVFWMAPPTDTKVRLSAVARGIQASFGVTHRSLGEGGKADTTDGVIADLEAPAVTLPSFPTRPSRATRPTRLTTPARPFSEPPIAELPVTQSLIAQSPDEFVPLMPMTEQELTGSFQLVRVQMPRASLGALRSPLEHPNELVEADVLLGEDGMARAIRVSTSGSVYPWRLR
jgi:hypothetical protein